MPRHFDQKETKRLQEMLDEIIDAKPDNTKDN
jgi:hypothetical protein